MSSRGSSISDFDVEGLLEGDENVQKEFKSGTVLREPDGKHQHEIAKQLVAFANREGGYLIFGVNDSGEIEDGEFDEESSIGTISRIARMRCNPPVDFTHEFHSQSQGDTTNGDVFIVIIEPRRSIPHAITEQSEGEIRKREYRIRSGDESRLMTDDELNWLFHNRFDELGRNYTCRSWFLFDEDGDSIAPPQRNTPAPPMRHQSSPELPIGSRYLANLVKQGPEFTDSDAASFPTMLPNFSIDLMPFALLLSMQSHFTDSWLINRDREWSQETSPKEVPAEMTDVIGIDDIEIQGEGRVFTHFDFDPIEALSECFEEDTEFSLSVPQGTSISIELDEPFPEPAIGVAEPNLILTNGDVFEFTIQNRLGMAGTNYPEGHPEGYRESRNVGTDGISSTELHITFTTEYGAPEIQDPYLEEHREYADNIEGILEHEWNADEYLNNRREELVFEIDGKIDKIMDSLEVGDED